MSKKHKKHNQVSNFSNSGASHTAVLSHEAEYKIIKSDLVRVLILNLVYLVAILVLYYGNQRSNFLDNWFAKVLHF
jgi:hypothetical protein